MYLIIELSLFLSLSPSYRMIIVQRDYTQIIILIARLPRRERKHRLAFDALVVVQILCTFPDTRDNKCDIIEYSESRTSALRIFRDVAILRLRSVS